MARSLESRGKFSLGRMLGKTGTWLAVIAIRLCLVCAEPHRICLCASSEHRVAMTPSLTA
ncbi:hypothetical protein NITLEN_110003 [Nitrospira lenta]|uniref:Uncharacterized protein n=1 Tax=Nitrospira lenta TaxID=1436998 RepID=A0A330L361_9BACT|nr:hypothetical protein NITLEN_110003 [Nitrospira lenta]